MLCEVIKKGKWRPGIPSCSVIHFLSKIARYSYGFMWIYVPMLSAGSGRRVANIGQWWLIMYITTAGNQLFDWKFQWFSACNHWHIQQKANIGKAALPVLEIIGDKWKAEDFLQWWSSGDRWIPMIHNVASSINFWLANGEINP